MTDEKMHEVVENLTQKALDAQDADNALKFSQAALNAADAFVRLRGATNSDDLDSGWR